MNILVTGASGFIGRNLVQRLASAGHQVYALVRPGAFPGAARPLNYVLGADKPLEIPREIEAVVHLAQSREHRNFPIDAGEMFRVNVAGTQCLLEASAAAGIRQFCLVSTGTVYEPFEGPLREDIFLAPSSYLGASKLAGEIIARPFSSIFKVAILRLFTPYGPSQTHRLIPNLIDRVRKGEAVALPDSGGGMRFAPTYVHDVCDLIEAALKEGWSDVVNIAGPENLTIAEAARIIAAKLGKPALFERRSMSAAIVVPDLSRLAARYDLSRFRNFETGLAAVLGVGASVG
jgi:UDP-glucose 4-epimerase